MMLRHETLGSRCVENGVDMFDWPGGNNIGIKLAQQFWVTAQTAERGRLELGVL